MAICSNCKSQVSDNMKFCNNCGTQIVNTQSAQEPVSGGLHCPQCKSKQLTPINESSVSSALTTTRSNISSTTFSNIHRSFWMCSNCGNKFRNIQSLKEEIERTKKQVKYSTVFTIISLIFSIIFISVATNSPLGFLMFTFVFGSVVATIVCFCMIFSYKNKVTKMEQELNYLQSNCFN